MLAIKFAFVLLVFNIVMSAIAGAQLFTGSQYYESEYINTYRENLPSNISTTSESQQYTATTNVISLIFNTVSFEWLRIYIPDSVEPDFNGFILGLDALGGLIVAIGFIEMFLARRGVI